MITEIVVIALVVLFLWLLYDICIKHKFNFGPVLTPFDPSFIEEKIRERLKNS